MLDLVAAAAPWTPDAEAFQAGVEMGLFATFAAVSALIVIATIRRLLGV